MRSLLLLRPLSSPLPIIIPTTAIILLTRSPPMVRPSRMKMFATHPILLVFLLSYDLSLGETIDTTHILVNNQEAKVYSPGYPPSSTDLSDPPHDSTPEHMNSFKSFGHASPVLHMNSYSSSLYTSSPSSLSHNHTTENQGEEDAPHPARSPRAARQ